MLFLEKSASQVGKVNSFHDIEHSYHTIPALWFALSAYYAENQIANTSICLKL